jgi:hypothetical protein
MGVVLRGGVRGGSGVGAENAHQITFWAIAADINTDLGCGAVINAAVVGIAAGDSRRVGSRMGRGTRVGLGVALSEDATTELR